MTLEKIISGGQNGADQAGLFVAKRFGLQTGGTLPRGCRTLDGPRPEFIGMFGMTEHSSDSYVPRTYQNVMDSDATVRLAADFGSPGERCTLKAIEKYEKPFFDVDLTDPPGVADFLQWLAEKQVKTLNVAGNAEKTYLGCRIRAQNFLTEAFFALGREMTVTAEEILSAFGLKTGVIRTVDGELVKILKIRSHCLKD